MDADIAWLRHVPSFSVIVECKVSAWHQRPVGSKILSTLAMSIQLRDATSDFANGSIFCSTTFQVLSVGH